MRTITYRFEVRASFELTTDGDSPNFYTEARATDEVQQRHIEKALHALLKRHCFYGSAQCDVELVDYSIDGDDPHGAACSCETCQMERAADTACEPRRS